MPAYWPEQWEQIQNLQDLKRQTLGLTGFQGIRSDANVMVNPVTGQEVPMQDLLYAAQHLNEIYNSDMIREDRWAFLWYH